ncbi:hypothetical protein ACFL52_03875 [Candidatus Margulisiibacteriota bacterium]
MKINNTVLFVFFCFLAVVLISCGQNTVDSSSGTRTFYSNTANTTPVFEPASASSSNIKKQAAWSSGNALYSVFFTLREYLTSRDEGIVDRSNLYKLLYDVDTVFSGISGEAAAITEQSITPPFSGFSAVTCNKAKNDTSGKRAIAIKQTGDETNAIVSWIWTDSATKEEYGIATLQFNNSTKDLEIDMVFSVDYDSGDTATDYNLRCQVAGNADNNTFQFKYIIGDTKIVAKGVSQGAGEYMLFKYASGSDPYKYLVASAEADEAFFIAENNTPSNIYSDTNLLPATVASYKTWVVNETPFSSSDLLTDISTLNSGNSKSGTIYISY